MINNRQNGRRRGRGGNNNGGGNGPRQGGQGRPDNGNRIDSRARGNANQLFEKYKNLASEAQRQGDRVNTEYYLQFADHYFRVLADQRGRSDDQQPMRRQRDDFDQFDDGDDFGDEGDPVRAEEQVRASEADTPRAERREGREGRPQHRDERVRHDRPREDRQREDRQPVAEERRPMRAPATEVEAGVADTAAAEEEGAPRRRRARKPREEAAAPDAAPAFDADRLPPALGTAVEPAGEDGEAPKPRRRRVRATPAEAAAAE